MVAFDCACFGGSAIVDDWLSVLAAHLVHVKLDLLLYVLRWGRMSLVFVKILYSRASSRNVYGYHPSIQLLAQLI